MLGLSRLLVTAGLVCQAALVACSTVKGIPFPSLMDATIDDLVEGLESGLFTSVDLTNAYLARIAQVNYTVRAVIETNPDALSIAADLDAQRSNGTIKGPLHGIPILLKDNIATADKMNNTAGSWGLVGATVPRDATVVSKLREAGAIILGKCNLSQWANARSRPSSNGWSAYGGQTLAAYHARQDPSGSSSGSGVSADLGLAAATLGTETSGSIISPSHRNSIVGLKPTVGRTSRHLVIPISERMDTVGPMVRSVRDAAIVLQAIAGEDPRDNYTSAAPDDAIDLVAATGPDARNALSGARIGVPWHVIDMLKDVFGEPGSLEPEVEAFKTGIDDMAAAGATIVNVTFAGANETVFGPGLTTVLTADILSNIPAYLEELTTNPNSLGSLADVRTYTQESGEKEGYPLYNTEVWDIAIDEQGWNNTDPRFWPVYQRNLELSGPLGLLGSISSNNLSAVALPTVMAATWAALPGAPVITIPLGFYPTDARVVENGPSNGGTVYSGPKVPFGLSFLGRLWGEEELVALGYAYEQLAGARGKVKPFIRPSIEIGDFAGF